MLLSFAVENFAAIATEQHLDMVEKSFTRSHPSDGDWLAVTRRVAGIFGANASGKTKMLEVLPRVNEAIRSGITAPLVLHHKLHEDRPAVFKVEYVYDAIRYQYEIQVDHQGQILVEQLRANETGRWKNIFDRNGSEISFGASSNIAAALRNAIVYTTRAEELVLTVWGTATGGQGKYLGAYTWWSKVTSIGVVEDRAKTSKLFSIIAKNTQWVSLAQKAVQAADLGISGAKVEEIKAAPEAVRRAHMFTQVANQLLDGVPLEEIEYDELTDAELQEILPAEFQLKFIHREQDTTYALDDKFESAGTRTWFGLIIFVIGALANGAILIVDELDENLHTVLTSLIIDLFNDPDVNLRGAQLLFTAQDTQLLNGTLQHNQIWFAQKINGETEVYSLADFGVRKANNITKRYLEGRFEALPLPDPYLKLAIAEFVQKVGQ